MIANTEALRVSLLALPEADLAELADLLWASLDPSPTTEEAKAFDAELDRRMDEMRSGRVAVHTKEELFAQVDARLAAIAAARR